MDATMKNNTAYTPKYKESKFIFDANTMTVVWGKYPKKEHQLWKGEATNGMKMELVGNPDEPENPTAYWGWSM